jgi:5-methylcytosine-specific restriction endonuclease McrA
VTVAQHVQDAVRAEHRPGVRGLGYAALAARHGLSKKQVAYILNEEKYQEASRLHMREYRQDETNRANSVARTNAWREADPELTRERDRARYAADSKKRLAVLNWQKNNPEKRRQSRRTYDARVRGAVGVGYTAAQWQQVLGVLGGLCVYCQHRAGDTLDHVTPLALGGTNEPHNLIPACHSCNSSKSDTPLSTWQGGQHLWVGSFARDVAEAIACP